MCMVFVTSAVTVSKILLKVVANRLQAHKKTQISNPLQSAYRKHFSTVSALLKVHVRTKTLLSVWTRMKLQLWHYTCRHKHVYLELLKYNFFFKIV